MPDGEHVLANGRDAAVQLLVALKRRRPVVGTLAHTACGGRTLPPCSLLLSRVHSFCFTDSSSAPGRRLPRLSGGRCSRYPSLSLPVAVHDVLACRACHVSLDCNTCVPVGVMTANNSFLSICNDKRKESKERQETQLPTAKDLRVLTADKDSS
jgi:hypothetical protein